MTANKMQGTKFHKFATSSKTDKFLSPAIRWPGNAFASSAWRGL